VSTEIQPGQTWEWNSPVGHHGPRFEVVEGIDSLGCVKVRYPDTNAFRVLATNVSSNAHPATPTPLDPSKVKAGDTVTLERESEGLSKVEGTVQSLHRSAARLAHGLMIRNIDQYVFWTDEWTLTAHQPAPEPEPEWPMGTVAEATVADHPGHRVMRIGQDPDAPTGLVWADALGHRLGESIVTDVHPLVVIDPLHIDVDDLVETFNDAMDTSTREALLAVLSDLGIEVAR